jgi:hypothetical protein
MKKHVDDIIKVLLEQNCNIQKSAKTTFLFYSHECSSRILLDLFLTYLNISTLWNMNSKKESKKKSVVFKECHEISVV